MSSDLFILKVIASVVNSSIIVHLLATIIA